MQKRKLGTAGPEVSLVGLGTNNFGGRIDLAASRLVVDKALDLGVTLIDTADIYGNKGGSEEVLGKSSARGRKNMVLATKFGLPMDDDRQASRRLAALHRRRRPKPACGASRPTGSISISSIVPIRRRRSKRPCARSTIWSKREKSASSAAPISRLRSLSRHKAS